MVFSDKSRSALFVFFALVLSIAALFHFAGIFIPVNDAPVWKHVVFVLVDLFFVYGTLKRPGYFIIFVLLFFLQQYYSHGSQLIDQWNQSRQIHWISVLVLLLFPIALVCFIEDYLLKRK